MNVQLPSNPHTITLGSVSQTTSVGIIAPQPTDLLTVHKTEPPKEVIRITDDCRFFVCGEEIEKKDLATKTFPALFMMLFNNDAVANYRTVLLEVLKAPTEEIPLFMGENDAVVDEIVKLRLR